MKGKDIGHVSVKVPKILELRASYCDSKSMFFTTFAHTSTGASSDTRGDD